MLRRELVDQRHRLINRFHLDEPAVVVERALNEFTPLQLWRKPGDFLLNRLEQPARSRHQPNALVAGTVLSLRE